MRLDHLLSRSTKGEVWVSSAFFYELVRVDILEIRDFDQLKEGFKGL